MVEYTAKCLKCKSRVKVVRSCKQTLLCCVSCGARFPVEKYKELMDDYLEDQLANIPCNRL